MVDLFKQLQKHLNFKIETNFKIDKYHGDLVISTNKSKYLIEFDGYRHFCDALTICRDDKKNLIWEREQKTKPIRIPYFIQLSTYNFKHLFYDLLSEYNYENNVEVENNYADGFIDKKCLLPASFCPLGILKFEYYLNVSNFSSIEDELKFKFHVHITENIIISLIEKILKKNTSLLAVVYENLLIKYNSEFEYINGTYFNNNLVIKNILDKYFDSKILMDRIKKVQKK